MHMHAERTGAQPPMRCIGIQARMPQQGNRELWRGERKGKAVHFGTKFPVGRSGGGDQGGAPRESKRSRNLPTMVTISRSNSMASRLHGSFVATSRETRTCPGSDIPGRSNLARAKRGGQCARLRQNGRGTKPEAAPLARGACCPCPTSARSAAERRVLPCPRAMSSGPKFSTKPSLVRSVNVRDQLFQAELLGRAKNRFRILHELTPKKSRESCWHISWPSTLIASDYGHRRHPRSPASCMILR